MLRDATGQAIAQVIEDGRAMHINHNDCFCSRTYVVPESNLTLRVLVFTNKDQSTARTHDRPHCQPGPAPAAHSPQTSQTADRTRPDEIISPPAPHTARSHSAPDRLSDPSSPSCDVVLRSMISNRTRGYRSRKRQRTHIGTHTPAHGLLSEVLEPCNKLATAEQPQREVAAHAPLTVTAHSMSVCQRGAASFPQHTLPIPLLPSPSRLRPKWAGAWPRTPPNPP